MTELQSWVGREEQHDDVLDLARAQRMDALVGRPASELQPGSSLPLGYHWLYCVSITPNAERGPDGHARRGGFLPPIENARRMWAGGTLRFLQPLQMGRAIDRQSQVASVEEKEGRTGKFHVVRVEHRIYGSGGLAIEERQNLVYLPRQPAAAPAKPAALTEPADWTDTFTPDEVTLFFFSALTMNGHRIHYDYRYATEVEGYTGLVVHGPLTALLLLNNAQRHGARIGTFTYKAVSPLYCGQPITLAGKVGANESRLWALNPDGAVGMEASVTR